MILGLLALTACGEREPVAAETPTASAEWSPALPAVNGAYELAMIRDVGADGSPMNEAVWNGVRSFAEENGISCAYYSPGEDTAESRAGTIGSAAGNGARVVVCPGASFEEAVREARATYPDLRFLLLDAEHPAADDPAYEAETNVRRIRFKEEQAGYLAGYAAVADGYTKLGFCGGRADPGVVRYGFGFLQGADAAAAEKGLAAGDVQIGYWYSDGSASADDIRARMDGWYSGGTEVVFACGGAFESVAGAAGTKIIGADVDRSGVSPLVVTSAVKDYANAVKLALAELYGGGMKWPAEPAARNSVLGAAEGCVGLPTAADSWRMTNFTADMYRAVYEKLASGAVAVDGGSDPAIHPAVTLVTVDYQE